jgi:hypothetical protein
MGLPGQKNDLKLALAGSMLHVLKLVSDPAHGRYSWSQIVEASLFLLYSIEGGIHSNMEFHPLFLFYF